jgi:hypothetical protein
LPVDANNWMYPTGAGSIIHQRSGRGKNFATRATIDVPGMVIGKVIAPEDPSVGGRLVEDRNVRLDSETLLTDPSASGYCWSAPGLSLRQLL